MTGGISKCASMSWGAVQSLPSKISSVVGTIFSFMKSAGPATKNGFVHSVVWIKGNSASMLQSLKGFTKDHPKLAAVVTVITLIGGAVATLLLCCHKEPTPTANGSSSPRNAQRTPSSDH